MMEDRRTEIPQGTLLRLETRFDELLIFAGRECKQYSARFRWASQEETSLGLSNLPGEIFFAYICIPGENDV